MQRGIWLLILVLNGLACGRGPEADDPISPAGVETGAAAGHATAESEAAEPFPLTDVTAVSGVAFSHHTGATGERHFPETMGPGVALFDADDDGDLDLYAVDGGRLPGTSGGEEAANRLFLNRGDGTFVDVTESAGVGDSGYGMGVVVGDYDGDGALDLYVLNYGPNRLYRNLGGGRFEPVSMGVEDPAWSVGGAFLDFDLDGDLDLFVVDYLRYEVATAVPCRAGRLSIYCSPEQYPPAGDRLFRNDGDRFTEVTAAAGIRADGRGMGVAVGDFDADGAPDLYVTNDKSQNFLYRNTGRGTFDEIGAEAGVGYGSTGEIEGGMGAVVGDFTSSGRPAIFMTNFQKEPNRLFVVGESGFFDDWTQRSGLGFAAREMVSWGMAALDLEGDGHLDLAVANGHVYDNAAEFIRGSDFVLADHLFRNDGSGRFTAEIFPGSALSSRGMAAGDLDGDGDPDLVVAACDAALRVWRNDVGQSRRFLRLRLQGRGRNPAAYGAQVTAWVGERTLWRAVTGGGGYLSHGALGIDLGLGEVGFATRVEVRWPDGTLESEHDLRGGQEVTWHQGEGIVARREFGGLDPQGAEE